MTLRVKHIIYLAFCLLVVGLVLGNRVHEVHRQRAIQAAREARQATRKAARANKKTKTIDSATSKMRTPIDWRKSSQTTPYPDLAKVRHLWVKVDLKKNRTYIYSGNRVIYTMYSTGGKYYTDQRTGERKSMTPTGTYQIEDQRGDNFYNAKLNEGANYYVSWRNHGTYLFHSVPTQKDGTYNKKEAAKLGKTQGSHGCIRLSVPDARWFSRTVPVGTKVVITG